MYIISNKLLNVISNIYIIFILNYTLLITLVFLVLIYIFSYFKRQLICLLNLEYLCGQNAMLIK